MTDPELARLDVLKREIIILSARLTRVINDSAHLARALRDTGYCVSPLGLPRDLQSEAIRQPTPLFGSGSREDHD